MPDSDPFDAGYLRGTHPDNKVAGGMSFWEIAADPNHVLPSGNSVFLTLLWQDSLTPEGLRFLFDKGADFFKENPTGDTPLANAVQWARADVMQAIIDCLGAGVVNRLEETHPRQRSLLHLAVQHHRADIAAMLIPLGANMNAVDDEGDSPLQIAVANGDLAMAQMLISMGADVAKYEQFSGISLLATLGDLEGKHPDAHEELAKLLADNGANLTPDAGGNEPLLVSFARRGRGMMVDFMLAAGVDPDLRGPENAEKSRMLAPLTALHYAINARNFKTCDALLQKGADPDRYHCAHGFPLTEAMLTNNRAFVDLLLEHGADVNAKDMDGASVLSAAIVFHAPVAMIEYLLQKGADVNAPCQDSTVYPSALHQAMRQRDFDAVSLLLKYGADPLVTNRHGETPLGMAYRLLPDNDLVVGRLYLAEMAARVQSGSGEKPKAPGTAAG